MKRINEISPVKDLAGISSIVAEEIFNIANKYLPQDCFWREGETIHIEVLKFIACILEENAPVSTDLICFYCSVQQSSYYEDCRHRSGSHYFH